MYHAASSLVGLESSVDGSDHNDIACILCRELLANMEVTFTIPDAFYK